MYIVVLEICNKILPQLIYCNTNLQTIADIFYDNFSESDIFFDDPIIANFSRNMSQNNDPNYFELFHINTDDKSNYKILDRLFGPIKDMDILMHYDMATVYVAKANENVLDALTKHCVSECAI